MNRAGYIVLSVAALMLFACGPRGSRSTSQQSSSNAERYEFRLPDVPPMLQGSEVKAYMRDHLWDKFDFTDTAQLAHLDRQQMEQALIIYTKTIPDTESGQYMKDLMRRASASKPMFDYFLALAERVLHDPNSPVRDDEKYIIVLEEALASDLLDEYEKLPYSSDLRMACQNRVGHRANDFIYTTAGGHSAPMSALKADYTLIFISNPDCAMCRSVKTHIERSQLLDQMISSGRMKVLVIYPDEDLTLWQAHLSDYPQAWINAYDKGCAITKEALYDLRAIPSLYLLDSHKRVLAKDCSDVGYIEKLIAARE